MSNSILPGKVGRTKYIPVVIAALLILTASIVLWYLPKEYAYHLQHGQDNQPENGMWDLTAFDLEKEIIFISGEVEYVTGALLTSEEFDNYDG
jgi:hypothetical protein